MKPSILPPEFPLVVFLYHEKRRYQCGAALPEEVVKVESLTKAYGALPAIDHVSLSVKRGTAFGLLGANGAGKSTTIECILGTKRADSGNVSVLTLDPRKDRRRLF